jgi:hypothetical protein
MTVAGSVNVYVNETGIRSMLKNGICCCSICAVTPKVLVFKNAGRRFDPSPATVFRIMSPAGAGE